MSTVQRQPIPIGNGFLQLQHKVAVVTGGARGIGYAIAARFFAAGACVVIADADEPTARKTATELDTVEDRVFAVRADVTAPAEIDALVRSVVERFDHIDIFVNNAGITGRTVPIWELTDEDWARVIAVDLTGVFNCCRAVIAHMRERKRGSIVNVASIAGKEGTPTMIPYSVAKAGVIALTKALAKEVILDGIRVNSVAPAAVETEILQHVAPGTIEYMRSKIPMQRFGTTEEIAAVVHFLASDDASFVTGQCYDISGGRATY